MAMRLLVGASLGLVALVAAETAQASSSYPGVVQADLSLSYAPPCSLCHEGGRTGAGTVTTPFGAALRARGAKGSDDAGLRAALAKLVADGADSDGDGVKDADELKKGTDPNGSGGAPLDAPEIGYGCGGATVAGHGPSRAPNAGLFAVGLVTGVVLLRRRRWLLVGALAALGASSCYDISYVSTDKCSTGAAWTGGEGERMDPGRACIECHSKGGGPRFTFAGTVMGKLTEEDNCIGPTGAQVILVGADGKAVSITTNDVGNFRTNLPLALPYRAKIVANGKTKEMTTPQTSGDCNACHTKTGANAAPGRLTMP